MPDSNKLELKLFKVAAECRSQIEAAKSRLANFPSLKYFPNGACGDASLILARYFREQGLTDSIEYVCTESMPSHAWLEISGWVIDITADQQGWKNPPVLVVDANKSLFHKKFKKLSRCLFQQKLEDAGSRYWVNGAYKRIFNQI